MLTLTVLGCDGSHAAAGGAASGYLVRCWETGTALWMDAGPGTFANLQRFIDPSALSAVVLTHEHVDHWGDIDGYITAARWVYRYARPPLPVYAPSGVLGRVQQPIDDILEWHEVGDGDGVRVGSVLLRFSRTDHPPLTLGTRVEGPAGSLGYSADSGPDWSFRALGPRLDLALCEATYTAEHEGTAGHMSGRQAGANARGARARRLVVTHRWPTIGEAPVVAEAVEAFGGPVDTAAVGRGFSI